MDSTNDSFSQNKKVLPEMLDEFRQALESEINASRKRSSSSAVSLVNGKKVGENGKQYQYTFILDSFLNAPEDSPADLIVSGKPPIQATIIAVEDLRVTIGISVDLGEFIPFAKLQNDLSILLHRLIERI